MNLPFIKQNQKDSTASQNASSAPKTGPQPLEFTLSDAIAPKEIEIDFNYLRINDHYYRSFFVSGYPRYVEPNWLEPLISFEHSLNISMFIYPSTSKNILDDLKRKIAEMEATIQTDMERGRAVDPAVQVALDDAKGLQEQLVKGAERFFRLALYITVPARDKEELNNISKLVESTLGSLSITARPTTLQMAEAFNSTAPLDLDILKLDHNMDTTSLATTFPFTTSELTSNEGIIYGINEHNGSLIIFDRFSLENANSVIFAKSGSGKSIYYGSNVLIQDQKGARIVLIGELIESLMSKSKTHKIEEGIEGVINPNLRVWTFDENLKGRWSNVSIAARKDFSPRNRLYQITTKSGRQITVTADHNLVIMRDGKVRVMRSEAVKAGEAIPLSRSISPPADPLTEITPREFISKWPDSLPQKIALDKPFLNLLGLITSEGHITPKTLQIFNNDPLVLDLIKDSATRLGVKKSPLYSYPSRKIRGFYIHPVIFVRLLIKLGIGGLSGTKRIPGILFSLSNQQIAHYLRAYYEGDGCMESRSATATTKSKDLASDLAYLLFRFGIVGRISEKVKIATNTVNRTPGTYYQITISGRDNLLRFAENIGFLTERKNSKLWQLLEKPSIANTNIDTIPTLQPIFKYLYSALFPSTEVPAPQKLITLKNGVYEPSREEVFKVIEICEQRITKLKSLKFQINLLRNLPSLSKIIKRGSSNRKLNTRLWQALGESWRGMKNSFYIPFTKNALLAYQTITGQTIAISQLNTAIYTSFKQQGVSLREYDKSLWSSLITRKTGNSSFETVFKAAKHISRKYRSTQLKIRHAQEKLAQLKQLANSDLLWDPIVKIERIKHKEKYVYDLQVDNGVFLAGHGGMFVHNSYMVKLEAMRYLMFGVQVIVIDPEHEYKKMCEAVGGEYVDFSSNSAVNINPFELASIAEEGENELGRKILTLTGFLKLVLGALDASQSAILDRALVTTYRLKGITQDPKTQHLSPPLMEDLYKVLIGMEDKSAQELAYRLERFIKGSLAGIFSAQSNLELNSPLIVFSVRDLADQLRPLAMYLILDYIWTKIRKDIQKRLLVVDEAWYMMQNEDSADFLVGIAKRARKYYLGVTTITQDVEDFLAGDKGKAIISNSSIQVLLKQAPASIEKVAKVFNLSEGEKLLLLSAGVGQGLFFAGPTHVAMSVVASPEEHKLITTNPAEVEAANREIGGS